MARRSNDPYAVGRAYPYGEKPHDPFPPRVRTHQRDEIQQPQAPEDAHDEPLYSNDVKKSGL
jgi:hypothetical protein